MKHPTTVFNLFAGIVISSMGVNAQDMPEPAEGIPEHYIHLYQVDEGFTSGALQQFHLEDRTWEPGDTLKVCFFGGNEVVRTLVAEVTREISQHANIRFDFGQPRTFRRCTDQSSGWNQIRVAFSGNSYSSLIGRDSDEKAEQRQPSMYLGGYASRYSSTQVSRMGQLYSVENVVQLAEPNHKGTIRHEMLHALGVLHEFQNPNLNCKAEIDWEKAYKYYGGYPNHWSKETVDFNLGEFGRLFPTAVPGTPDKKSNMLYSQPEDIFFKKRESPCYTEPNNVLSDGDKKLLATLYPSDAPPISDTRFSISARQPNASTAAAAPLNAGLIEDRLTRTKVDLLSDVTTARREARRQLAKEITASNNPALIKDLLAEAQNGPYREQLGVLVALSEAQISFPLTAEDKSELQKSLDIIAKSSTDNTLQNTVRSATERILTSR